MHQRAPYAVSPLGIAKLPISLVLISIILLGASGAEAIYEVAQIGRVRLISFFKVWVTIKRERTIKMLNIIYIVTALLTGTVFGKSLMTYSG